MAAAELHPELDRVLIETLQRSEKPQSINQLQAQLNPPFRFPGALQNGVKDLLRKLEQQGDVCIWPGRFQRYWHKSLQDWAYERALASLSEEPLSKDALMSRISSRTHSLSKSVRERLLADWKREGRLVVEPQRGARWRLAAHGSIRALRSELLRVAKELRAQGVDPVGVLSERPGAAPASAPTPSSERLEERILAALDRLMPEPGAVVSVTALRSDPGLAGIDKESFDAAVLGLVRRGTLFPHGHNDPYSLAEERRRSLVAAGGNLFYVALGRR